jgi:hypothetical protein
MKNRTLGSYISDRLGVDDELCSFYKSPSFWGVAAFALVVLADLTSKIRLFVNSDNLLLWVLNIAIVAAAVIFYAGLRRKITSLADFTNMALQYNETLRSISRGATVLASLAVLCVLYTLTFGMK